MKKLHNLLLLILCAIPSLIAQDLATKIYPEQSLEKPKTRNGIRKIIIGSLIMSVSGYWLVPQCWKMFKKGWNPPMLKIEGDSSKFNGKRWVLNGSALVAAGLGACFIYDGLTDLQVFKKAQKHTFKKRDNDSEKNNDQDEQCS